MGDKFVFSDQKLTKKHGPLGDIAYYFKGPFNWGVSWKKCSKPTFEYGSAPWAPRSMHHLKFLLRGWDHDVSKGICCENQLPLYSWIDFSGNWNIRHGVGDIEWNERRNCLKWCHNTRVFFLLRMGVPPCPNAPSSAMLSCIERGCIFFRNPIHTLDGDHSYTKKHLFFYK